MQFSLDWYNFDMKHTMVDADETPSAMLSYTSVDMPRGERRQSALKTRWAPQE